MFQGFERPYGVELKLKSVEGKENQQYQLEDFLKLKRSGLELEKADNSNAENFPQDDYPISLESDIQQENDVVHPQGEDLPSNMSLDNPKTYETFRTWSFEHNKAVEIGHNPNCDGLQQKVLIFENLIPASSMHLIYESSI